MFFIAAKLSAERSYIAVLLVFYNSKNLNCIGVLSFLRLEEEYWRSPFYNSKNLNCIGSFFQGSVLTFPSHEAKKRVVLRREMYAL